MSADVVLVIVVTAVLFDAVMSMAWHPMWMTLLIDRVRVRFVKRSRS